jgi:hypothetical protein
VVGDGAGFAEALAVGLRDNDGLQTLNLAQNDIGKLVLLDGWHAERICTGGRWSDGYRHVDGTVQIENPALPIGVIAVAGAVKTHKALGKLDLSNNKLVGRDSGAALGEMLGENTGLQELDLSDNHVPSMVLSAAYDMCTEGAVGFAEGLAVGLATNATLQTLKGEFCFQSSCDYPLSINRMSIRCPLTFL